MQMFVRPGNKNNKERLISQPTSPDDARHVAWSPRDSGIALHVSHTSAKSRKAGNPFQQVGPPRNYAGCNRDNQRSSWPHPGPPRTIWGRATKTGLARSTPPCLPTPVGCHRHAPTRLQCKSNPERTKVNSKPNPLK